MYEVIPIEELTCVEGDLTRAANALNGVWNDQQFDYFCQHYVQEAENLLYQEISHVETLIQELHVVQCELENLE